MIATYLKVVEESVVRRSLLVGDDRIDIDFFCSLPSIVGCETNFPLALLLDLRDG